MVGGGPQPLGPGRRGARPGDARGPNTQRRGDNNNGPSGEGNSFRDGQSGEERSMAGTPRQRSANPRAAAGGFKMPLLPRPSRSTPELLRRFSAHVCAARRARCRSARQPPGPRPQTPPGFSSKPVWGGGDLVAKQEFQQGGKEKKTQNAQPYTHTHVWPLLASGVIM